MPFTTYAELQEAIGRWLIRNDLTTAAPEFIALAEARMNRDIRHWRMEARTDLTIDSRTVSLPSDFREAKRIYLDGTSRSLEQVRSDWLQDQQDRYGYATGEPQYYAINAGQFEFFPTPGNTYTGKLLYVQDIPALSDSNTSNWLLAEAPDVYLFGSMIQAEPYLAEDERLPVWAAKYQSAVRELNIESDRAKFGKAKVR